MQDPESALALKKWLKSNGGEFNQDTTYCKGDKLSFLEKYFDY